MGVCGRALTTPSNSYPRFWFGNEEKDLCRFGNGADQKARDGIEGAQDWTFAPCSDGYAYTSPVGSFPANNFGLRDMAGNTWQWTADCYKDSYKGAPTDGSVWASGDCSRRILRGGSWVDNPRFFRAASRSGATPDGRLSAIGFRVGRTLLTP